MTFKSVKSFFLCFIKFCVYLKTYKVKPITEEERDEYFRITEGIVSLGVKLGYFEYLSKEKDWYDLTEKGILAKSKGGHFKYIDFIEKSELEKIRLTIVAEIILAEIITELNHQITFLIVR